MSSLAISTSRGLLSTDTVLVRRFPFLEWFTSLPRRPVSAVASTLQQHAHYSAPKNLSDSTNTVGRCVWSNTCSSRCSGLGRTAIRVFSPRSNRSGRRCTPPRSPPWWRAAMSPHPVPCPRRFSPGKEHDKSNNDAKVYANKSGTEWDPWGRHHNLFIVFYHDGNVDVAKKTF